MDVHVKFLVRLLLNVKKDGDKRRVADLTVNDVSANTWGHVRQKANRGSVKQAKKNK